MLINRQLGDYLLVKRLATGGMAEIFLALKRGPGTFEKLVALKTIVSGRTDNDLYQQMFAIEAEVAAYFNHPHVVQLYDVMQVDGMDCMVMEYIPGHTLEEIVEACVQRGEPMPPDLAVWLMMEVCEGLDYVHKLRHWDGTPLGIVHRDMSPQNVMVTYDGHAKVFDFGIAFMAARGHDELQGQLVGKYSYMSPEQCRGEPIDARSDVWSAGVMLWELTTGQRLFDHANELKTIRALTEDPIPKPSERRQRYPRFLERIVMQALEKDREERYPSCAKLREDLKKYLKISALKPDRRKVADLVSRVFARDVEDFHQLMRMVRSDMPSMDDTQSIDVRSLVEMLGEDSEIEDLEDDPYEVDTSPDSIDDEAPTNQVAAEKIKQAQELLAARQLAMEPTLDVDRDGQVPLLPRAPQSDPEGDEAFDSVDVDLEEDEPTINRSQPLPVQPAPQRRRVSLLGVLTLVVFGIGALSVGAVGAFFYTGGDLAQFLGEEPAPAPKPEPTAGSITLETEPEGANIYLDGRLLTVTTPVTLPGLSLGETVVVTIEKTGYAPVQQNLEVTRDEPDRTLSLTLEKEAEGGEGLGTLRVTTSPQDASVYIDNNHVALGTPVTLSDLSAGDEHSLRISREGYQDALLAFTLEKDEVKDVEIELSESSAAAMGVLSISSVPTGRRVTINGEYVGRTSVNGLKLPSNTPLTIAVTDRSLGRWTEQVILKPGQVRHLRATFGAVAEAEAETRDDDDGDGDDETNAAADADTIPVSITSEPSTTVWIAGRDRGRTPIAEVALPVGTHKIEFRDADKHIAYSRSLAIAEGDTKKSLDVTIPQGKLNVSSKPAADVYVDGEKLGTTPVRGHPLFAGNHDVKLEVSSLGRVKEFRIRIRGGDTRTIDEKFDAIKIARVDEPAGDEDDKDNKSDDKTDEEQPGQEDPPPKKDPPPAENKEEAPTTKEDKPKPPAKPKTKELEGEPYPLMQ